MKPALEWRQNGWPAYSSAAGWQLFRGEEHLGTVFVDGRWYWAGGGYDHGGGSQPLAAQALLRAAGLA